MIEFINIFIKKIKSKKVNFIKDMVGIKNGWNNINYNNLKLFDIKINKIISINNISMVSEIQFLPTFMIEYKLKVHSLYSILRLNEYYNNYNLIKDNLMNDKKYLLQLYKMENGIIDWISVDIP